jgi:hypothetical protein
MSIADVINAHIQASGGILRLRPAWVAHDFLEPGRRLGLREEDYDAGERGQIMERWMCSETHAVNRIDLPNEGMSYLEIPGEDILVADAVAACPERILGADYAASHNSLGRLIKIFDFGTRLFFHMHQRAEHLVGQNKSPKDEAYYFLDAPLGDHPESFFGVQRFLVEQGQHLAYFRKILEDWDKDETEVLKYSMGFVNVPGEGFFLDSGILHAPGTALTLEIQEPSDVGAIFQPIVAGHRIDREMLFKDVHPDDVAARGIDAVLDQVDWEASSDPRFFEKRHLRPKPVEQTRQADLAEDWIYYGTPKFSGKRLVLPPGREFRSVEEGVHNIFVWRGEGLVGGQYVKAGAFDLKRCDDELLVVHDVAAAGYTIKNTGGSPLVLFKIFGPGMNLTTMPSLGYGCD